MALKKFSASRPLTLGIELELQLINKNDHDLISRSFEVLKIVENRSFSGDIKQEMTESMIEISTGVCTTPAQALSELEGLREILVQAANTLDIHVCGGGTHPFQEWREQKIVNDARGIFLSEIYGYLCQQFTVFGQHVHIGCPGPDEALCLLHALSRYIPHFIALSASSPFVQGVNTGYDSARLNSVFAFPLSGRAPLLMTWAEFDVYFAKMSRTGVVNSMKDFYWDIRPKPEFGTIEVRVMDTPLTLYKASALAAYIQTLARWLLVEKPVRPEEEDYLVYNFNRFQACRFGFDGVMVDARTGARKSIREDILETIEAIESHAMELNTEKECLSLREDAMKNGNDASWIRGIFSQEHSLVAVMKHQCERWQ